MITETVAPGASLLQTQTLHLSPLWAPLAPVPGSQPNLPITAQPAPHRLSVPTSLPASAPPTWAAPCSSSPAPSWARPPASDSQWGSGRQAGCVRERRLLTRALLAPLPSSACPPSVLAAAIPSAGERVRVRERGAPVDGSEPPVDVGRRSTAAGFPGAAGLSSDAWRLWALAVSRERGRGSGGPCSEVPGWFTAGFRPPPRSPPPFPIQDAPTSAPPSALGLREDETEVRRTGSVGLVLT